MLIVTDTASYNRKGGNVSYKWHCQVIWQSLPVTPSGTDCQSSPFIHQGPGPIVATLLMSSSKSRCHMFCGWPLFLFPWGFQVRACLVILNVGLWWVWTIHLQCLFCDVIFYRFIRCHSSWLLLVSGQQILRILLMKVTAVAVPAVTNTATYNWRQTFNSASYIL